MIIGLSGKLGSGKSSVARYLSNEHGYRILSSRKLLENILKSNNETTTIENLQNLGARLISVIHGPGFMTLMLEGITKEDVVIDAIRQVDAIDYLRRCFPSKFKHVYVETNFDNRYFRVNNRDGKLDKAKLELLDKAETEEENALLKSGADFVLENDSEISSFYKSIENILKKI
jgi:dephospho-CoA kinase